MYLIDSSVWIDFLNNKTNNDVDACISLEKSGLTMLIYTKILQGASTQKMFDTYKSYLSAQPFYDFKDDKTSYEKAAHIYFKCRKKGVTIRSAIDCLIAQCAVENDLILLHNDNDFSKISTVIPFLKQQKI